MEICGGDGVGSRPNSRLEAVGRLAAGIAHEINTPIQFKAWQYEIAAMLSQILFELRKRENHYDPEVLNALELVVGCHRAMVIREYAIRDLKTNTILAEDVKTPEGFLIVGKGQEVTSSLCQRLLNLARRRGLEDTLRVRVCEW